MRRYFPALIVVLFCVALLLVGCHTGRAARAGSAPQSSGPAETSSEPSGAAAGSSSMGCSSAGSSNTGGFGKSSSQAPDSSAPVSYDRYGNPRFGFWIDYPADLTPQADPANGDGQIFLSADKTVKMTASGNNNAGFDGTPFSPADYFSKLVLPSVSHIAYQTEGKNWIILSWTEGDRIGYQKTVVGSKSVNEFTLEYPSARKAAFDPVIRHILGSFQTPEIDRFH